MQLKCRACSDFPREEASEPFARIKIAGDLARGSKEKKYMLGVLAAVLIVLWLLGFFAFHVTTSFIHIALILGLILLVMHFLRGSTASV